MIINFMIYFHFPIMRFLCRDKGNLKSKHKTFSLLPYPLVPYQQTGLEVMLETVKHQHAGKSLKQTKDHISQMGVNTDLPLDDKQIHNFWKIFTDAFIKLITVPQLKHRLRQMPGFNHADPIGSVIAFIDSYQPSLPGLLADNGAPIVILAQEFFFYFQTGAWFNRNFLFGTPSQHR